VVLGVAEVAGRVGAVIWRAAGVGSAGAARALTGWRLEGLLLVLLFVLCIGMALWAHHIQPPFHSDGINLQPPANLLLHGKYATRSALGFDLETYRISTGPAMLLPIALVYKLFGIQLQHAHIVSLAFFLAFLAVTYRWLRPYFGGATVLLGLLFFAMNPANIFYGSSNGYISAGMGESPALFYLLCGAALWGAALARASDWKLFAAGVFFGLAFQSKWLFLFALPAVVAAWVLLALAGRRLPSRVYLLPAGGLLLAPLAFFLMRLSEFGVRGELQHMTWLWQQHGGRAAGFHAGEGQVQSIFALARPLITLAQVDFWALLGGFLTLPALVYGAVLLKRRPEPLPLYLMTFTGLWAVWWVFMSYDLPVQHLLYIWPFVQILVAKLLVDGWQKAIAWRAAAPPAHRLLPSCVLAVIALIVFGKTTVPLLGQVDEMVLGSRTLTPGYREMMAFIDDRTEENAVFSGWNWSMPWWVAIEHDRMIKDRSRYPLEQRESAPEYLMITPEWPLEGDAPGWPNMAYLSRWTLRQNARRREFIDHHCTHLLTTGTDHHWTLYKVNPTANAQASAPPAVATVTAATGKAAPTAAGNPIGNRR
jgi:hypothetical protein